MLQAIHSRLHQPHSNTGVSARQVEHCKAYMADSQRASVQQSEAAQSLLGLVSELLADGSGGESHGRSQSSAGARVMQAGVVDGVCVCVCVGVWEGRGVSAC